MNDMHHHDDLDRALFALPLEQPPAELRDRILSATIYRPSLPVFRQWEILLLGTVVALLAWLIVALPAGVGITINHAAGDLAAALHGLGLLDGTTVVSIGLGVWSAWVISRLPFMPDRRSGVYNR